MTCWYSSSALHLEYATDLEIDINKSTSLVVVSLICLYVCIWYTVYGKTFKGGNFRGFSLNRECFPMNYGLVVCNWQCKSTGMLP